MNNYILQYRDYVQKNIDKLSQCYSYNNHYSFRIYSASILPNNIQLTSSQQVYELRQYPIQAYSETHRVCFGAFLGAVRNYSGSRYRSMFVWMPYLKPYNDSSANFTWMTREQLEKHVNYCKEVLGLDYDVMVYPKPIKEGLGEYYQIIFDFKELEYFAIKFILFWARYSSEYPSNSAMLDAMILQDIYPEEELYNLLIMSSFVNNSMRKGKYPGYISEGQCMSIYGKFITREKLIEKLRARYGYVIEMFERTSSDLIKIVKDKDGYITDRSESDYKKKIDSFNIPEYNPSKTINKINYIDFSKWVNDEEIDKRLRVYEQLYPWYKEEEIK